MERPRGHAIALVRQRAQIRTPGATAPDHVDRSRGGWEALYGCGRHDPVRQEVRGAGSRVPPQVGDDPPDPNEEFLREHGRRGTVCVGAPPGEHEDPVGVARREVEVVERRDHRHAALAAQPTDPLEQVELVADVEVGRRFVQEENRGLLGERPGEDRALALATAEREDPVAGPVGEADLLEHTPSDREVLRGLAFEGTEVGIATVEDVLLDRDVVAGRLFLRDPCDPSGPLADVEVRYGTAEHLHRPLVRVHEAEQGAEERRLPRAVRPGERDELAGSDGEVHPLKRGPLAVAHRDLPQPDCRAGDDRRAHRPPIVVRRRRR